MATTTILGLELPDFDADLDTWSQILEAYFNALEAALLTVAGRPRQEVTATGAGTTTSSTSFVNVSSSNVPITPKGASSKLLVECSFTGSSAYLLDTNTSATFQIYDVENTTLIGAARVLSVSTASGGTGISAPCVVRAVVTNAVTTARNFQLQAKTNNASAAAGATSQVWSIREIAV